MRQILLLLRHPEKEDDLDGIYRGHEAKITERGLRQVEAVTSMLVDLQIDAILSSALMRTGLMAAHIADRLQRPVTIEPLLNELDKPKHLIGKRYDHPEARALMQEHRDRFDEDHVPEGSGLQSRSMLEQEMRDLFTRIERMPQHRILAVTHAKRIAACRHWVYKGERTLEGYYREADRTLLIENTDIFVLIRQPDRRTGEPHWHIGSLESLRRADDGLFDSALLDSLAAKA